MPGIQCADPLREIGIAWDHSISHNGQFVENMSWAIRLYQSLGMDANSHPVVIKMEKELGNNLLQNARLTLLLTLKSLDLPYQTNLQFSDQGNKIYHGMKIGSFSLGYCLATLANTAKKRNSCIITNMFHKRVSKLYAATYIDTFGNQKIMHLYDYGNNETKLIRKLKLEITKYKNTIGLRGYFGLGYY